jgi:hypothetical protein
MALRARRRPPTHRPRLIDTELELGRSLRSVGLEYSLSKDTVHKHKVKVTSAIVPPVAPWSRSPESR